MAKNTDIQVAENLTDNFRCYAALLRKINQRVLIAQQRVIYAVNEEMLRIYWDIGGILQQIKMLTAGAKRLCNSCLWI